MEPGPRLAGILASIDRDSLCGRELVVLMRAERRQSDHYQARSYATMSSVAVSVGELDPEAPPEQVTDEAASEIRAALTLTRRSAEAQLDFATTLTEDYPQVWEVLQAGLIDVPKAMVLVNTTSHLEPEHRTAVVDRVLQSASGLTTGQLRARIDRLAIAVDPDTAKKRYEQGVEERKVALEANPDGTATLYGLQLPVERANVCMRRVNQLAKSLRSESETRSIDQLRADVFLDLLAGKASTAGTAGSVEVRMELETLLELSEQPGEIPGWGPVIADVARQVSETTSSFHYTVTGNGHPIWTGTSRRRPNTHQTRSVEARNPNCVFPGCRMPATDCDLDHTRAWADGGQTTEENLAPLCRHDHQLKHGHWQLQSTSPGHYQWTSPLGHTYHTGPDPP
jgi:hypothetical protein